MNNTSKHLGVKPKTRSEMVKFLKERLTILFEEFEVDLLYLGGSWANDLHDWWSDIDIFISAPDFPQLNTKNQLNFLTRLHVKATDLTTLEKIEISVLETLPLHVQFSVISKGILLHEKEEDTCSRFKEKLLPLYYDHAIWYKRLLDQSEFIH